MIGPPSLLGALDEVEAGLRSARHLLLLLDFDGTLAPIAEAPGLARLPPRTRSRIETLARRPDSTIGIISGRALEDVRRLVGIDGLVYAGNHGLEIRGRGLQFAHALATDLSERVARVADKLRADLGEIDGVLVEAKGLTASVHFRNVLVGRRADVEHRVFSTIPDHDPDLMATAGKMVWEIRPRVSWDKGSAVRWIREHLGLQRAMTIYLGDDRTDEDAFAEIGRFVTARVGPPQATRAGYNLADTDSVANFLDWLSHVAPHAEEHDGT